MSTHTPTPWHTDENTDTFAISLHGQDGLPICRMGGNITQDRTTDNAAFIVKAVNAHDELVAVVRLISQYVGRAVDSPAGAVAALNNIRGVLQGGSGIVSGTLAALAKVQS